MCPEPDASLRVLVVDDHPIWRHGVATGLEEAGCAVAGTAGDGAAALRVAAATRPGVVLLDLNLPDMSGAEVTRRLLAADPAVRVLILSASGERQDVLDAMTAGATGYLVKSAHFSELLAAVRSTAAGEAVFTPGLAGLVLGEYRRLASGSTRPRGGPGTPGRQPPRLAPSARQPWRAPHPRPPGPVTPRGPHGQPSVGRGCEFGARRRAANSHSSAPSTRGRAAGGGCRLCAGLRGWVR